MPKTDITARIRPLCERTAKELGFELVDVSLDREPAGKYLRVYIDREGGMDLDGCEAFHRKILPLVGDYDYDFLECCSPGADRPLKTDADFDRALGSEVELKLFRAVEGVKEARGILTGYTPEAFTLLQPDGQEREWQRKACASVKPVIDMSGVEDVEL
ncbi:MAG: ribosome maturation factor RimP [Clostridia bacterium]|nr:ribosome maturation factor RimP [Clostridia bacterium]